MVCWPSQLPPAAPGMTESNCSRPRSEMPRSRRQARWPGAKPPHAPDGGRRLPADAHASSLHLGDRDIYQH
eukprot:13102991-Alexandrium_andersonii.AAC.1